DAWTDGAWMIASWLLLVSAQYQYWAAGRPAPAPRTQPTAPLVLSPAPTINLLPYVAVALTYGALLIANAGQPGAQLLGDTVRGLRLLPPIAVARQILAARDLGRLHSARAADAARSEDRFRALLQNSADLIIVVDEAGVVQYESSNRGALL